MTATFDELIDYATLTETLERWQNAHPDFCRLESAGKSGEGRDLWVLVVGREPDRARHVHDTHLARARWMTEHGYRLLVREGRAH